MFRGVDITRASILAPTKRWACNFYSADPDETATTPAVRQSIRRYLSLLVIFPFPFSFSICCGKMTIYRRATDPFSPRRAEAAPHTRSDLMILTARVTKIEHFATEAITNNARSLIGIFSCEVFVLSLRTRNWFACALCWNTRYIFQECGRVPAWRLVLMRLCVFLDLTSGKKFSSFLSSSLGVKRDQGHDSRNENVGD